MNLFGKLPQEQAMQTLVHDSNQECSRLRMTGREISEWLDKNKQALSDAGINATQLYITIERIKSRDAGFKKVIDNYYLKFKDDFPASN